jgi:competence protein ComGC
MIFFFIPEITKENFVKGKKRGYTWLEVFIGATLAIIVMVLMAIYLPQLEEEQIPDYYPPHSTRL